MPCLRCEQLPTLAHGAGHLTLWFPLGHSLSKARRALAEVTADAREGEHGEVIIDVADGRAGLVAAAIARSLSDAEAADTRCLFKAGDAPATIADMGEIRSLSSFVRLYDDGWFLDLLEHERLSSIFQPIVAANDRSAVFGHEALVRGRLPDGDVVMPDRLFREARETGLLFNFDLACRKSAIRGAAERGLGRSGGARVFVNFTPTSIYDPAYCLRSTMAAVDRADISREQVVFEVIETDRASHVGHLRGILEFYRSAGFQVALDDVGAGYSSLNLLHQLRPDFVKLDMQLVRGVDADPFKAVVAGKLLETAHLLGIATIAEGVETEEELRWCAENGATYVQGYLIGRPA